MNVRFSSRRGGGRDLDVKVGFAGRSSTCRVKESRRCWYRKFV
jgi:hypothetical protein